ncbi:lysoplasmalogenase [Phycicoccus sp. MAQZ13P-2]|uniref:lysoplasmalogenase n=1 Tax=Phycicoccus mangrovi TaxID=2840470 RepID=UPI001C00151A|nr:lysoplasmalogenase [Phycicoccus mangrovi]MBT9257881.1 lysoplasmalogenase [Phycicoccus mangrovi]MBT9272884.1 lysoplasmalogenase [Phycicoccus mangrovi]
MLAVAAVLTAVVALADWWAVATRRHDLERWAKPAVMVGLVAVALAGGALDHPAGPALLVALVLGGVGDVLLLGDSEPRFVAGLAAFLVGHLAYVLAFVRDGLDHPALAAAGAATVAVALVAGRRILPAATRDGGAGLGAAVGVYMAVIAAMAVTGWATGSPLVAAGVTLFVVSDTLLALDRFVTPRPGARLAVIVTYHLAQALIVAGILV